MTPTSLRVRINGIAAATVSHAASSTTLAYEVGYLNHPDAVPLSLSLPLRTQPHTGPLIETWLDGLLPDGWRTEPGGQQLVLGLRSQPPGSVQNTIEVPMAA